jgi:hypothetical protein
VGNLRLSYHKVVKVIIFRRCQYKKSKMYNCRSKHIRGEKWPRYGRPTSYHELNFPATIFHGTVLNICTVLGAHTLATFPQIFLALRHRFHQTTAYATLQLLFLLTVM